MGSGWEWVDGLRAGLQCGGGVGVLGRRQVGVWTQISVGRFGCWVIRSQQCRCLPCFSKSGVLGKPSLMPSLGVQGFRDGVGDAQVRI